MRLRLRDYSEWTPWFAWRPVFADDAAGGMHIVWLRWVQRRDYYEYPGCSEHRLA